MTAVRRTHPSDPPSSGPGIGPASGRDGARAKTLRRFERREASPATRAALAYFEDVARDYELVRTARHESRLADTVPLRRAAARVLESLCKELDERTGALSKSLVSDLERWREGEFAGSDTDVEIANHAIHDLIDSDICAELPVADA